MADAWARIAAERIKELKEETMPEKMMARILNLIAQALTGIATGNYSYAGDMLRKAARQLDEA